MELLGWVSTILLSVCGVPLAVEALKEGRTEANKLFLILWGLGEGLGLIYCLYLGSSPLVVNYSFNMALILIVLRYRFFPRSTND